MEETSDRIVVFELKDLEPQEIRSEYRDRGDSIELNQNLT